MYDTPRTTEQILIMLAEQPSRLAGLAEGLRQALLHASPEPGESPVRDVLAHLRACADMWGSYITQIHSQDRPPFKAVDPTTWTKSTGYLTQEIETSLQAFRTQRLGLLNILKAFASDAWSRTVVVTGAGKPRERNAHTYAMWLANHELTRVRQIEQIVNGMRLLS